MKKLGPSSSPFVRPSRGVTRVLLTVLLVTTLFLGAFLVSAGQGSEAGPDVIAPAKSVVVAVGETSMLADYLSDPATPWLDAVAQIDPHRSRLATETRQLYSDRDYETAWIGSNPIQHKARALVNLFHKAERYGYDAERYGVQDLARQVKLLEVSKAPDLLERMELETRLTATLLLFTRDIHEGRVSPENLPDWHKDKAPADVVAMVRKAMDADSLKARRKYLEPKLEGYRQLANAAGFYRELEEKGGWPRVPESDTLELGDTLEAEHFAALIGRLQAEGDLSLDYVISEPVYDGTVETAVGAFQKRHGLEVDGKLGENTLAAMNVSISDRLWQIEANLERWRWLPERLPADRIDVNVPAFMLKGFRNHQAEIEMAVAVGKPSWATPIFEDEVLYAQLNPYWNVPESIASDEILPKLEEDPSYLKKENMEVVPGWNAEAPEAGKVKLDLDDPGVYGADYRIRQRPGAQNALGQIKFIFPNRHGIYLHDTPAQRAFERKYRAVSHGCIRVSDPWALAEFVFPKRVYEEIDILAEAESDPERFNLEEPLPVMLHYWTAFPGSDGRMQFRKDIYGLDEVIAERLEDRFETDLVPDEDDSEDPSTGEELAVTSAP